MPRYDYFCANCEKTVEIIHSIKECDLPRYCFKCFLPLERQVAILHIEGSLIYPLWLDNLEDTADPRGLYIEDKVAHKKALGKWGLTSPAFMVGG